MIYLGEIDKRSRYWIDHGYKWLNRCIYRICDKEAKKMSKIDWKKLALIHELEGTKPKVYTKDKKRVIGSLDLVTQDISRKEIPEYVCKELINAGFQSATAKPSNARDIRCKVKRVEEQLCALRRMLPYYMSQDTKNKVTEYIQDTEKVKRTRPRIPFECPE